MAVPAVALFSVMATTPLACRRSIDDPPVVSLASSTEADARFASVRLRWASATPAERAAMRPELDELVRFLEKTDDGLTDLARAYLAIAWLDAGVPAAAEAVARPMVEGAPGVAHDLATLVKGAAARRTGHSADAILILRPLAGKLIDPFARPILYEELVEALLDEGRFDEALVYAEAWLRSGGPGSAKELNATVARVLERIPEPVASRVLEAERQTKGGAGHSPELLLILGKHVDKLIAVSPMEDAGPTDAKSKDMDKDKEAGVSIAPADAGIGGAYSGATIRFDPRAIALLLPSSVPGVAVVSAAIVRAAAATTTPTMSGTSKKGDAGVDGSTAASAPSTTAHRLSVFDTLGTAVGAGHALEAAERDGAAVVVGGATDLEANALAQLAQMRHIAVVLLRKPTVSPILASGDRQMWIALGPTSEEEAKATLAAADGIAGEHAVVEPVPITSPAPPQSADPLRARCDATAKTVDTTAFPVAVWRAKKVSAIVLLGDHRCTKRVLAELSSGKGPPYRPQIVVAPSSLEIAHDAVPFARSIVTAGILPAGDDAPSTLRALWADQASPVGWWGALGHDATLLAITATPGDLLPASDSAGVAKARATTVTRLFAAKAELWTTATGSVGAGGIVSRTMSTRAVAANVGIRPSWLSDDDHPVYK